MTQRLVFIHTVPLLVDVFNRLAAELLPGVGRMHILDEPLLERVIQRGASAPEDAQRLAEHVSLAAAIGVQAVLVTCSTLSPSVDDLPGAIPIPVFKIDAAMIRQAVSLGGRIGVLATNASTLRPTQSLLETEAALAGRSITTTLRLVEDAALHFKAVMAPDTTGWSRRQFSSWRRRLTSWCSPRRPWPGCCR